MRHLTRIVWLLCLSVAFAPGTAQCASEKEGMDSKKSVMTIEEIAAVETVAALTQLAKDRGISFSIQTAETMKAQRLPEFDEAKLLGAVGRVWVTFWVREESDTVHVSFFFDAGQHVIGRQLKIETNNLP